MPMRSSSLDKYRYGFNGQEKENSVNGSYSTPTQSATSKVLLLGTEVMADGQAAHRAFTLFIRKKPEPYWYANQNMNKGINYRPDNRNLHIVRNIYLLF